MTDQQPPWREITTHEYESRIFPAPTGSAAWIASLDRVYDILFEQQEGRCRLQPIPREAVDLKRGL
ncbi:hypothetical protein [Methylobacterium sp. V23]|uniref:hypothetical protein n=1 Tax=Methylobacterium sp. V23 TaxID=2044878 RepID=UPI000CDA8461|nr:hypothetical protein [Methylobacterium sp. V23]POR41824.1 hypothetical protein CRT23_17025 [Methylobacterium sp. V23]